MFDDLIDVHNGQSGILAILLNRIVIIVHRYEELNAIGLALVLKDDQLAQLCRSASNGCQLSLFDDELDGSWSERVIERNGGAAERSCGQISQYPLCSILAINTHESPGLALGLNILHHVKRLDAASQIVDVVSALLPRFPHVRLTLLALVPPSEEVLVRPYVTRLVEGIDDSGHPVVEWTRHNVRILIQETAQMSRITWLLGALDESSVLRLRLRITHLNLNKMI